MINKLESLIGQAVLIFIYGFFAVKGMHSLELMLSKPWSTETWLLDLIIRVAGFAFLVLLAATTIIRLPAKGTAAGIEPRISAILGTFTTLTLIVMPKGEIPVEAKYLALFLILAGTILSIYCLYFLGRSFSVMAHARKLVTYGPYSIVRHPLYAAEMITLFGVTIANFSWQATVVILITVAFQFRRMVNEQNILRATFPEYVDYEKRVPMIIPAIRSQKLRAQR